MVVKGGANKQAVYRLFKNLGNEAPKILRCHAVYDPNSETIIGEADAAEVSL